MRFNWAFVQTVAHPSRDRGRLGPDGALHGAGHLQVPKGRARGSLLPPGRFKSLQTWLGPSSTWANYPESTPVDPAVVCCCVKWWQCNMSVIFYFFPSFRRNLLWTHQKIESTRPRSCSSPSTSLGSTSLCRYQEELSHLLFKVSILPPGHLLNSLIYVKKKTQTNHKPEAV